ncbi:hypothetical protein ACF044_16505 [Microbacterium sp. NPDC016588]|uniref:hypothetical protein n=1 Tax=Microbacterium TaxID=33882 RepID=UPI0007F37C94|nr:MULTISPECIES: hypothetical protein [unclassified Microbacterium]OAN39355.1 hypothetical protein A4X16_14605 [Microbacterium sp. H83]TCJ21216.1 hypothetical protein E0W80_17350 [Microbacterium sp. PI-1]
MSDAAQIVDEEVVYIGRKQAGNGKLAHWYRPLVNGVLEEREIGSYKPYLSVPVGAIVTITRPADEPESLFVRGAHGPRLTGSWQDTAEISEWRTRDRAEYQRDANERRVKRDLDGLPDDFESAIDILGKHFSRLNNSQRAALMTLVTARILRY